jgi:4-hydroxybenzoate polyprenyltransferase
MMRIISGAIAANLDISIWLLSFSLFFFFSFALLKRYSELRHHYSSDNKYFGRGYTRGDLPLIRNMGISSSLISILVIGLYFNNDMIYINYHAPKLLLFFLPILLIWISSIWSRAIKGVEINDPISFSLRDLTSIIIFFISLLIFTFARYEILLI